MGSAVHRIAPLRSHHTNGLEVALDLGCAAALEGSMVYKERLVLDRGVWYSLVCRDLMLGHPKGLERGNAQLGWSHSRLGPMRREKGRDTVTVDET